MNKPYLFIFNLPIRSLACCGFTLLSCWCEPREQLGIVGILYAGGTSVDLLSGVLSCAQGRTLPSLTFAEWLKGPADQMWWLYGGLSTLAVGSLQWLGRWPGCRPADPELQTWSENSEQPWICPYHEVLSALRERAHSSYFNPLLVLVNTATFPLRIPAELNTHCRV